VAKRVQRSRKRKEKKNVSYGVAHIYSTFNNTIVTLTDKQGNALSWASGGNQSAYKGARKSTPYAAQMSAAQAAKLAQDHGVAEDRRRGKRPGSWP
jgi:small subunit ribosomal protein S11